MGLSKQTVFDRYASESVRNAGAAFNDFITNTPIDADVEGTVASTTTFGVFVTVEPGVEGLLHVSELEG
ncbi:MAG: S1 RNA-binding domain-containing protein [Acidimicrobiales bacterium]